ncbi:bromodomain and phd finger-containing protein 3 [Fagus crenata]
MAYRRRQGMTRTSTFKEEIHHPPDNTNSSSSSSSSDSSSSSSLAAQAIRASAVHRESSLSSAYADSAFASRPSKSFAAYGDGSTRGDSKSGFWGVLARKAKAILDEDNMSQQHDMPDRMRSQPFNTSPTGQQSYQSSENFRKMENPAFRKGLDAITSSLNHIGDTFEKAFEEGRTIVESKTADIIQETRKLQNKRRGNNYEEPNRASNVNNSWQQSLNQPTQPQLQTNHETQIKASRDVAMATAAKAKLLLRELKTVKADLAFAKERCAQLEEENKLLRENREKGDHRADDDLIRLQLETLLAEKARLAHENSIYARENRFLREIVEYHQLTMQDVVYIDDGNEEVTEVYPISSPGVSKMLSISPTSPTSPPSPSEITPPVSPPVMKEILPMPTSPQQNEDVQESEVLQSLSTSVDEQEDTKRQSVSSS